MAYKKMKKEMLPAKLSSKMAMWGMKAWTWKK
jgi:hypothetical protein